MVMVKVSIRVKVSRGCLPWRFVGFCYLCLYMHACAYVLSGSAHNNEK